MDPGRYLLVHLPPLTDEAALMLREVLADALKRVEETYDGQIDRAYRQRRRNYLRELELQKRLAAQLPLPLTVPDDEWEDIPF